MGRTDDCAVNSLFFLVLKKYKLICYCALLSLSVLIQCACTSNTAVNPYYTSCIMVQDNLYVLDSIIVNDELPNDLTNIGNVNSFWGGLPRKNGETNDLNIEEGSQIYCSAELPNIAYIHSEYTDEYFKFICCDICVVIDDFFYVDDPRYTWEDEDTAPEGYVLIDNVKCLEDKRLPLSHLETVGLPEGTSLYRHENQENWQYIYACVKENEHFAYKKLSVLTGIA